jgi:hypothetical protein
MSNGVFRFINLGEDGLLTSSILERFQQDLDWHPIQNLRHEFFEYVIVILMISQRVGNESR